MKAPHIHLRVGVSHIWSMRFFIGTSVGAVMFLVLQKYVPALFLNYTLIPLIISILFVALLIKKIRWGPILETYLVGFCVGFSFQIIYNELVGAGVI